MWWCLTGASKFTVQCLLWFTENRKIDLNDHWLICSWWHHKTSLGVGAGNGMSYALTISLQKNRTAHQIYPSHYCDVIIGAMASQITSLTSVCSTVYSDADQRKHQSSASLAFVREIHRWPVNSPHKWPVTRKVFPFDDIIMFPKQHTKYLFVIISVEVIYQLLEINGNIFWGFINVGSIQGSFNTMRAWTLLCWTA